MVGDDVIRWVRLLTFSDDRMALLDGEVLEAQKTYLIYDVIVALGAQVSGERTSRRLSMINKIVHRYRHMEDKDRPRKLVPMGKRFVPKLDIGGVLSLITRGEQHGTYVYTERRSDGMTRTNPNDGLIFTPEHEPYMQAHHTLLKWKWLELNTVDFKIKTPYVDKRGKLRLYVGGPDGQDIWVRDTNVSYAEWAQYGTMLSNQDSAIVECGYNPLTGNWDIHKLRMDKHRANFITTFTMTLEGMIDNVTAEDLCVACESARPCPTRWRKT